MTIFETIRARINFSNVAERYTDFRRSGNRLLGRCPLPNHDDPSPSFFVYPTITLTAGDMTAIYDGEFAKWTGTRGNVSYAARFSLIGCVTPLTLAEHHRYMNMIGARFLNYRVAELNSESVRDGFNAVWNGQVTAKTRLRQLASAYATQLHQKLSRGELTIPTFNDNSKVTLNTLAQFLACGRAAVRTQRAEITSDSGKTTTVYNIAEVQREEPFRALLQLRSLATALAIVHERKEVSEHELELCRRVVGS